MEKENDTATVEQATTTEETGTEETQAPDDSAITDKLSELGEKLNAIEGRLNRQTKKVEKKSETPSKNEDSELKERVESLSMQVAGITEDDEVKLAKDLQEETGLSMDKLLTSKYFKSELDELRTQKENAASTSNVKGDKTGSGNVKQSAEYWIAKGEYPKHEQVSDRKVRQEIRKALVDKEKGSSGKFYNS